MPFWKSIRLPYLKCVLAGDANVGKTCLNIANYKDWHCYPAKYIHVDNITFSRYGYEMEVIDTRGWDGSVYERLRPLYYPSTDAFLVCYAVDNPDSLANVTKKWLPELSNHLPRDVPLILVGTKSDIRRGPRYKECVPLSEAYTVAVENSMYYAEASALTQDGVHKLFDKAIELAIDPATQRDKHTRKKTTQTRFVTPHHMPTVVKVPRVEVTASTYSKQMENALTDTETADVIFLLDGGQKVKGHKVILCSASNFFCEVFGIAGLDEDGTITASYTYEDINAGNVVGLNSIEDIVDSEGRQITEITLKEDISVYTFSLVMEFLYTGLPKFQEGIDDTILRDLARLADLFSLSYLKDMLNNIDLNHLNLNASIETYAMERMGQRAKLLFLGKETFSDVKFNLQDAVIPAHKVLLMNRCEVMARMFGGKFAENTSGEATIKEDSKDCFMALLEYIYTDRAPLEEGDTLGILTISDKYNLERLKCLGELYISEELNRDVICKGETPDNLIGLLQMAEFLHAEQLVHWCLHYMCSNYHRYKDESHLQGENLDYITKNRWPPPSYLAHLEQHESEQQEIATQMKRKACRIM